MVALAKQEHGNKRMNVFKAKFFRFSFPGIYRYYKKDNRKNVKNLKRFARKGRTAIGRKLRCSRRRTG